MATMIAVAAEAMRPAAAAASLALVARPSPRAKWSFGLLHVRAFSSSQEQSTSRKLVLYTKPGCCLCEGLKEKLQAAFFLGGPDSLSDVQLQIRDISTNSEWEKSYQYEIPVLARILSDGTEETLPRLSPRLGIELIQKKIAAALKE
ncbi:hypothetical protein MRB53_000300 [Persea americana]|uniref:Uncharacterized protein n=1 Tax=Persea americana TaxID=3435 RepID=A0ACC2MNH1_PERAE|nr:hypothetical protein MRB53_000300 [Persea americana]|eukprot:TRINITY_DN10872_c1_g3_i1.p1 TRINITY_DN10872_c1_g3~~TRINITY_DN10872_c1_g3_i1.p1  ORF type:complete len:147 (+),score=38.93 TRINITY_DN10872_c1_g3_i1:637-1077(+)